MLGLSVFLRVEEAHETVRHDGKEYRVVNAPADVEVKKTTLVTRSCQLTPQLTGLGTVASVNNAAGRGGHGSTRMLSTGMELRPDSIMSPHRPILSMMRSRETARASHHGGCD